MRNQGCCAHYRPLMGEGGPLSASTEDHSLLEEQASIPARLASVDNGVSFARTFIELFAREPLQRYVFFLELVDNFLTFLLNFRNLFGSVDLHHSKSGFFDEDIERYELLTAFQSCRQLR